MYANIAYAYVLMSHDIKSLYIDHQLQMGGLSLHR